MICSTVLSVFVSAVPAPSVGIIVLIAVHVLYAVDGILWTSGIADPDDCPVHVYVGGPGSLVDSHITWVRSPSTTDNSPDRVCVPTFKTGVLGGTEIELTIK